MRFLKSRTLIFLSFIMLALCIAPLARRSSAGAFDPQNSNTKQTANVAGVIHGFDPANLDRSANACTDFNAFANGGWMANNPVPPAYARWGKFEIVAERNQDVLHEILENAAKNTRAKPGSLEQKLGDYYSSCMDEAKLETEGVKPIEPELQRINAITDLAGLEAQIARLHNYGLRGVFGFGAAQDFKNSTQVIAQASQGGLGMPDRDYYTKDDDKSKTIREAYVKHVAKMLELAGDGAGKSADEAKTIFDLEKKLADVSKTRVERRDPAANYHKMTVAELNEITPHFDWAQYLSRRNIANAKFINVGQPDFFKAIDKMLTSVPLEDWKTYLRWHVINASASLLSSAFVQEDFDFNGRTLSGTKELLPRWKRCTQGTDNVLGEALGQLYVQKTFTPEAKAHAQTMVKNLIDALREDLQTLSWMSPTTRARATAKLDAYMRKIGYPDKWRNYEALNVSRGAYAENARRGSEFELRRNLGKIGQPVDRAEWGMSPPTVNAYYNPSLNEIVFPAGILQPPFYDPLADDAVNYGGIGAAIGHEMTHGFDDQGARFDAEGNLVDWWSPEDFKSFKAKTDCVVNQFSSYEAEPGLHLKGELVVGESVADLGGLTVAYRAFKKATEGKPQKLIDGFTPDQRFFLGWAQVWAANIRPEEARRRVVTDPHPLSRFRVNGPLSNMAEFATAYSCKAGDLMVRPPDKRCQIW
ncbi:MAG: putative endopeptidase [Acidobacteriota bacterium]|nr:putative endopeptidase [Acidobacteriota bacterium]